jgi:type VI secretion system protein ImpM
MIASSDLKPGIYGKLPSNGDFVTRRLPASFVEPWDLWLQESIVVSQDQLGERWLDTYLTSPVWRFALSPGCAGQSGWAGLLMPSVDRVGRFFPLTLASPLPAADNPLSAVTGAESWYQSAENLLLSCLENDLELEDFDRQVVEIGVPPSKLQADGLFQGMSSARRMPLPHDLLTLCPGLLHHSLGELFFAYSLWWSHGSEIVAPSVLLCQGLPPSSGFVSMLAADWGRWGWEEARVLPIKDAPPGRQGS